MTAIGITWRIATISLLILGTNGAIYSNEMMRSSEARLVDLNSERGLIVKQSIFDRRLQRSAVLQPDVTEFVLKNDTTHNQALIHWSGNDSQVIFILTRKKSGALANKVAESTLWRSKDYGKHYVYMSDKFASDTILTSYFISPTDKTKVIFVDAVNNSNRIWLSVDEGENYSPVHVGFSVDKIDFHPVNSDWLLAYDKTRKELHCSLNFGQTWSKLGDQVSNDRYYWYVKGVDEGEDAHKIVFFEYRSVSRFFDRIYRVKSCYIPNCNPTSFQKKFDELENIDEDSLVIQNQYIFVQKSGASTKLFVSYKRRPFVKALFPFYTGQSQAHFHIVSSDGGCVVIGINHDNGLAHLFFSNTEGQKYRQSLSNVRYFNKKSSDNRVFNVDVYKIQGIVGTYIANVHHPSGMNTTKVSWNNGQTWSTIMDNVQDIDGKAQDQSTCTKCSLNLHLTMEQTKSGYYMQSILAKSSFPGLIIAHGTYGRSVVDDPDKVMLYISRDNGQSWKVARTQRHFVVVSNHGAVIVAIKMIFLKPVDKFWFSSNYGRTWMSHSFTESNINVDGILTEPGETKPHITVFGHKSYQGSWRLFQIDVSPLFAANCVYPQDFENVTIPSQVIGCHLGLIQQYEILKQGKNCLIQKNYSRVATKKKCDCVRKDYECDLGYEPVMSDGQLTCKQDRLSVIDDIGVDVSVIYPNSIFDDKSKCIDGRRNVSSGMRKVPGNQCINEVTGIYWRYVPCGDSTTTFSPTPCNLSIRIKLQNNSNIVRLGEAVAFSVQGGIDGHDIVWRISPEVTVGNEKGQVFKRPNSENPLNFVGHEPGEYSIRAELDGTSVSSQWETVQFWYPIKKVFLYHPPVVSKKMYYNVTAWTQTVYGLRGNQSLLGDVGYIWDVGSITIPRRSKNNMFHGISSNISPVEIRVTADNTVSKQSTSGKMLVRDFSVQLVMEMNCNPKMSLADMNDEWLHEFRQAIAMDLLHKDSVRSVKEKYGLTHEISLYIYIPPGHPLTVSLYFAPSEPTHTKDNLLEAASEMENILGEPAYSIYLAQDQIATTTKLYIIDYDGTIHIFPSYPSSNGPLIAVVIVLVLIVIVAGFFTFRHYSRRLRFDRYLHFRNLRPGSSRNSRIVRSQDRSPIVDDEFIDDDLNAMEEIGSQDATLQFQG